MTELLEPTAPTALTSSALRELAEVGGGLVITVVIPTDRATSQPQQNAVRLKNAIQSIEQQLADRGLDPPRIDEHTAPLQRLQGDEVFWGHQLDALYVTVWEGGWRAFRLPYEASERAVVDARPHLQPLLPEVAEEGTFYVLAISQAHVRLLRASHSEVTRVDLTEVEMPHSVDDVVPEDREQAPGLQHHGSAGGRTAIFHGHTDPGHYQGRLVEKFLHRVARGVDDLLATDPHPVVLAGVDTECAELRRHTGLATVLEDHIPGNPDEARDDELRDAAWPLVEPVLRRPIDEAVEKLHANLGTGLGLADLPEILPAAEMGRVGQLLVREGAERWGRFDVTDGLLADRAERAGPDDEDLVEHAIALTLQRGGDAYLLSRDAMPVDSDVGAVCRY
jgi:hypothetical protein